MDTSLDRLTADDFTPLVGETFAFDAGEPGRFELELLEVNAAAGPGVPTAERMPFELLFRGPAEPVFAQQIFPLEHAALGRLDIFLVPVARDQDGARYEAIFS
ncbi:MAG: hypothetical protein QOH13_2185 [Thermoleophilaceae bacterium]|nr:hypothetical protein [Thermoleophilaceae bacterium]